MTRQRSGGLARALTKDAAIYGVGDIAGRALSFISVPVYTRLFDQEQYSVLAFLTTVTGLMSAVLILGGDTTYTRFFFERSSDRERRDLTTTWLGFLVLWAAAVTLLLLPFAGPAADWAFGDAGGGELFTLLLLSLPIALASRMLAQGLRNEFRAWAYASTSFATSALGLTLSLLLVTTRGMGVAGVLVGYLVADVTVGAIRALLARHLFLGGRFHRELLPPLLRFGAPLIAVSVSFWTFQMSDRLMLVKLADLRDLADYSLAIAITSVLVLISGAAASAWTPRAFSLYEEDPERTATVVGALIGYFTTALAVSGLVVATAAREVVGLVAPPSYDRAEDVIPILTIGLVASGSAVLTGTGISIRRRTSYAARYAGYAAVVNVVVAIALIPALGMYGAATASATGYLVLTFGYLWRSQRLWPVPIDGRRLGILCGGLALATAATSLDEVQASPVKWLIPVAFLWLMITAGPTPWKRVRSVLREIAQRPTAA